jgi:hypothetical protein
MAKTIVALFNKYDDAQDAVNDLLHAGFQREEISLISREKNAKREREVNASDSNDVNDGAAIGAVGGTLIGGTAGLLIGLGALTIPGIGPVLAFGPLMAALGSTALGAGLGAAAGGLLGALMGAGVPEEDAHIYTEGVRRGGSLVAVNVEEQDRLDKAYALLQREGAVDIEAQGQHWRSEGWERFDHTAEDYNRDDIDLDRAVNDGTKREGDVPVPIVAPVSGTGNSIGTPVVGVAGPAVGALSSGVEDPDSEEAKAQQILADRIANAADEELMRSGKIKLDDSADDRRVDESSMDTRSSELHRDLSTSSRSGEEYNDLNRDVHENRPLSENESSSMGSEFIDDSSAVREVDDIQRDLDENRPVSDSSGIFDSSLDTDDLQSMRQADDVLRDEEDNGFISQDLYDRDRDLSRDRVSDLEMRTDSSMLYDDSSDRDDYPDDLAVDRQINDANAMLHDESGTRLHSDSLSDRDLSESDPRLPRDTSERHDYHDPSSVERDTSERHDYREGRFDDGMNRDIQDRREGNFDDGMNRDIQDQREGNFDDGMSHEAPDLHRGRFDEGMQSLGSAGYRDTTIEPSDSMLRNNIPEDLASDSYIGRDHSDDSLLRNQDRMDQAAYNQPESDPDLGRSSVEQQEYTEALHGNRMASSDDAHMADQLNTNPHDDVGAPSWNTYVSNFRNDYDTNYGSGDYSWDEFSSAYRYGYDVANDNRYTGRSWEEIESTLHGGWDDDNYGPWDRFKDAVRYAWEQSKNALER